MQFLPCAWGSGVATTRSERCESKTRPALETLPLSLCLPTLTLLSPRTSAPGRFALPPSKLGRCTFLLCFLSSFIWRGLHPITGAPGSEECSWGRPGAGDEERHQPPETFWERCPAAPSFNQREHPASTSKKGNAASFLSEDKTAFT